MRLDSLELRVPPLALTITAAVAMPWLPKLSNASFAPFAAVVGGALCAGGMLVALLGVRAFRQARTTVDPRTPERSAALVQTGIYARTRNPMYVGFVALLLGLAVALQSLAGLAVAAGVALYLHRFQIIPEERWMRQRFGREFDAYCARVARWVG